MIQALLSLVTAVCGVLSFAILARAVLSWFQPNPYSPAMQLLTRVTDPILTPIQRFLPSFGGLDLSPLVALLFLSYLPDWVRILVLVVFG